MGLYSPGSIAEFWENWHEGFAYWSTYSRLLDQLGNPMDGEMSLERAAVIMQTIRKAVQAQGWGVYVMLVNLLWYAEHFERDGDEMTPTELWWKMMEALALNLPLAKD